MDVEDLKDMRGNNTELISVYINKDHNINAMKSKLQQQLAKSDNIKSKETRGNVKAALKRIIRVLKGINNLDTSLVVFSGDVDKQEVCEVYEVEGEVPNKYYCDNTFYVQPLLDVLNKDKISIGLIVLDRKEAVIGEHVNNSTMELEHINSLVPSKHSQGGQSAQRFERDIEERAKQYYKKVCEKAKHLIGSHDYVFVGGTGLTPTNFLKNCDIGAQDTYTVEYTNINGLNELTDKAHKTIEEKHKGKQKEKIEEFKKKITQDMATYGQDVQRVLRMGAGDTLLTTNDEHKELAEKYGTNIIDIDTSTDYGKNFKDTFEHGLILRYEVK